MKCVICQGPVKVFLKKEGFLIYRCGGCGLGITEGLQVKGDSYHRDEVYAGEREQFTNIFKRRTNLIKKYAKNPGKVLEIGSSTGTMLSVFKKEGWKVLGIEVSPKAADFAIKSGIPTVKSTFEKTSLPRESFDVVIINHTLEHLELPEDILEKVYGLLKMGGLILIDVPNFGSFSAGFLKGRWPYLLPQEHRWHFTFDALKQILSRSGFEVLESSMPSGIWDYGNPLLELWQSFRGGKKRFFKDFITAIPSLLLTLLGKGTSLTVLARKK